ncbi:hypothetical protein [Pelagibacterium lentulum]|uniref:Uncharacterized protein n=1 Tax=Pelagibacterium lentulum TaxID=2029865 RepID=A0A916RAX6_9HYPH|nr:hypothetical protein [Pelagibacterium lentulum]GGA46868.1 hypothetical protein GCM10011499_15810 [Pelagibacterium lentulum]
MAEKNGKKPEYGSDAHNKAMGRAAFKFAAFLAAVIALFYAVQWLTYTGLSVFSGQ